MPKPKKELTVERSSREVLEGKLLACLTDGSGKVAIVATEADLDLLIAGLSLLRQRTVGRKLTKVVEMRDDLRRLKKEAFGA